MAALEPPNLVALSLTNVYYNPTDPIAHLLAYLTLTPQLLLAVYLTLLYTTREAEVLLTFGGQLACEALNIALKRWFKELRPALMRELHRGYGMPSSHAQFVAYFAVYMGLFMLWRHSPSVRVLEDDPREADGVWDAVRAVKGEPGAAKETRRRTPRQRRTSVVINGVERPLDPAVARYVGEGRPRARRSGSYEAASAAYSLQLHHPRLTHAALTAGVVVLAVVVAASRVYLQYHTLRQVVAGGVAGGAFAVAWFGVTEWLRRTGWVQWALGLRIVRSMRIRDLVCEEDLVEIGWQVWEDKRRQRKAMQHARAAQSVQST